MTEGEIIAAIEAAWDEHRVSAEGSDGALTREEIQEATGWGRDKTHVAIRQLVRAGVLEHVRVPRKLVTGVVRKLSAYRPVKPA